MDPKAQEMLEILALIELVTMLNLEHRRREKSETFAPEVKSEYADLMKRLTTTGN